VDALQNKLKKGQTIPRVSRFPDHSSLPSREYTAFDFIKPTQIKLPAKINPEIKPTCEKKNT